MRFLVIVKATKNSETGLLPDEEMFREMGEFNKELVKAGVILAADGLHPSSKGVRVRFSGANRTVTKGPFAATEELVAGFWIWKCESMQEAIEWVKRCPNPMPGEDSDIEIRQIYEAEDFAAEFSPKFREEEKELRREIEQLQQADLQGSGGAGRGAPRIEDMRMEGREPAVRSEAKG